MGPRTYRRLGGGAPGTLGNIFRFFNCNDLTIDGLKVDYDPPLFTQGAVTAVQHATVGGVPPHFRYRPDPGFEFAWRTADFFGSYDKASGQFQETNFEDAFSDDEGGKYTIQELLVPGGGVPEFVFTPPALSTGAARDIPVWMATGQQIWIAVRKRLSSPFTFVRGERLNASVSLGGAAGVGIVGNGLVDPTINFYSKGIMSGAAGGVVLLDVRGKYTSQTHESHGLGDDNLNIRTRLWDKVIVAHSSGGDSNEPFIRLDCRNPAYSLPGNFPEPPDIGDSIEFWDGTGRLVDTISVSNVTQETFGNQPTRRFLVEFPKALPDNDQPSTEYVDNWLTLNRAWVPEIKIGSIKQYGGIRTLFPNSHKWHVDHMHVENVRSTGFRHSFPASGAHPDYGGAKGNGTIDLMTVINAVFRYTLDGNAVINVQFNESNGTTPYSGPPQGFPPITIGRLDVKGCGYGVSYVTGLELNIGHRVLRDTGNLRATSGVSPAVPGYYDDYIQYGALSVASDAYAPAYRFYEGEQGRIIVMPDPIALRIGTHVHSENDGMIALPLETAVNIVITATFTQDRTIVLSDQGAKIGDRFNIDSVGGGDKKARIRQKTSSTTPTLLDLAPQQWARFIFDGVNWRLEDNGAFVI